MDLPEMKDIEKGFHLAFDYALLRIVTNAEVDRIKLFKNHEGRDCLELHKGKDMVWVYVNEIEDVRAKLSEVASAKGMDVARELLGEYSAVKISDVKPAQYGGFMAKCEELISG